MAGHQPIRALLFDFVGVLLIQREDHLPGQTVEAVDDLVGGVTDDRAFRQAVCRQYGLAEAAFQEVLGKIVDRYVPFRPLWEALPELRRRYKLAVVNNGTWLTFPLFDARFGMTGRFDVFISSAVEGVRKPEERIYLQACQRLGVPPEHCLFMDDLEHNVAGAQQAGLQAIHWKNHAEGFQLLLTTLERKQVRSACP
jgi:HAD superfamily hydrolase (TIGR01509 family)